MEPIADYTVPPGARRAGKVVGFEAPLLRIRYPHGVYVTLEGYLDWQPYARAIVSLPPADEQVSPDQQRVTDVLAANLAMAASGDPLWSDPPGATPDGWLWRHLPEDRRMALVPAEAGLAFRHAGGLALTGSPDGRSGLAIGRAAAGVSFRAAEPVAAGDLDALQRDLAGPLPAPYRDFLTRYGAARPEQPAVHPGFGFVLDQAFFHVGQGRKNLLSSVGYLRRWFGDRFTGDMLAVAPVQGGLLALRLTGPDAGSVWFWDADDPRDDDRYDAAVVTRDLLRRCADRFDAFLEQLIPAPLDAARASVDSGLVHLVREPGMGASLLARDRPPTGGMR